MDAGDEAAATRAPRRPRVAVLLVLLVAALAVAVGAVLLVGGAIADRLRDEEPSSVSVTQPTSTTSTTEDPVVLAPPVSIDNTTPAGG